MPERVPLSHADSVRQSIIKGNTTAMILIIWLEYIVVFFAANPVGFVMGMALLVYAQFRLLQNISEDKQQKRMRKIILQNAHAWEYRLTHLHLKFPRLRFKRKPA